MNKLILTMASISILTGCASLRTSNNELFTSTGENCQDLEKQVIDNDNAPDGLISCINGDTFATTPDFYTWWKVSTAPGPLNLIGNTYKLQYFKNIDEFNAKFEVIKHNKVIAAHDSCVNSVKQAKIDYDIAVANYNASLLKYNSELPKYNKAFAIYEKNRLKYNRIEENNNKIENLMDNSVYNNCKDSGYSFQDCLQLKWTYKMMPSENEEKIMNQFRKSHGYVKNNVAPTISVSEPETPVKPTVPTIYQCN